MHPTCFNCLYCNLSLPSVNWYQAWNTSLPNCPNINNTNKKKILHLPHCVWNGIQLKYYKCVWQYLPDDGHNAPHFLLYLNTLSTGTSGLSPYVDDARPLRLHAPCLLHRCSEITSIRPSVAETMDGYTTNQVQSKSVSWGKVGTNARSFQCSQSNLSGVTLRIPIMSLLCLFEL